MLYSVIYIGWRLTIDSAATNELNDVWMMAKMLHRFHLSKNIIHFLFSCTDCKKRTTEYNQNKSYVCHLLLSNHCSFFTCYHFANCKKNSNKSQSQQLINLSVYLCIYLLKMYNSMIVNAVLKIDTTCDTNNC